MKKPSKSIELNEEEIHYLYSMLHLMGFREKREFSKGFSGRRTDMQRIMGRIMKKLRKANHFIAD